MLALGNDSDPTTLDAGDGGGCDRNRNSHPRSRPYDSCHWHWYAGPADITGRIARISINLDNWHDVPLAEWLEAKTGRPTTVANDATVRGWGKPCMEPDSPFKI